MRIYLDARNITAQPAGVARYAQCLIPELVRQAPEYDFVLIRHRSNDTPLLVEPGRVREVFMERHIGKLGDFLVGAPALQDAFRRIGQPDLYHNLFHISPLFVANACKHVVTLHDFIWIDYPKQSQGTWLKALGMYSFGRLSIGQTLRRADRVIAISDATAQGARRWIGEEKIDIIGHGVEKKYFEGYPQPDWDWSAPYVLAVANDKPYKNLSLVVEAFAKVHAKQPSARLVLVGRCDGLKQQIARLGLSKVVVLPGFLSEEALMRVFAHASVFVFPSLVEGFGLPPLEAMAMGVPTIVSDVEPMRSVVGDAAQCVDPSDAQALAAMVIALLQDEQLAARWRALGRERAASWTWQRTAEQTLRVYQETLNR